MIKYSTLIAFFVLHQAFTQDFDKLLTEHLYHSAWQWSFKDKSVEQALLKIDFNQIEIIDEVNTPLLNHKDIDVLSVQLLYSDYPKGKDFTALNKGRLTALQNKYPELFKDPYIRWEAIAQTNCDVLECAKAMFHGFVITFRPKPTKELTELELKSIEDYIKTDPTPKLSRQDSLMEQYCNEVNGAFDGDKKFKCEAYYKKRERLLSGKPTDGPKDSTYIIKGLFNERYKNFALVIDVTASMSDYSAEILYGLKRFPEKFPFKAVTVFNDGDRKLLPEKKLGFAGGVYSTNTIDFNSVRSIIEQGMHNGNGGDAPENNVEALIKTLENYPDIEGFVMLGDSWAEVRDITLIDLVKKPVHVFLCGNGQQKDYSMITTKTNGTLFYEKDFYDRSEK